ncbi:DUF1330 domain-containing protein [Pseudomonas sp. MYb193]|uniref:DUF1330 domain-containing protein n=1 Tax=Pseudomonas sp. MYb193 TaxID=1827300 RepID=UPI000CF60719|nr:DUF1330 domain-containing protein [Pseudomonas sp. MYb193]AVJ24093.1 hypothetical protein CLM72_21135 [Pseudomonas sp. MYb193]
MEKINKGYVLAIISVDDPEVFKQYVARTPHAVEKFRGTFLSRGTDYTIHEGGSDPARIVLLEFESYKVAKDFYESPEYQEAANFRRKSAATHFFILNGYDHSLAAIVPGGLKEKGD